MKATNNVLSSIYACIGPPILMRDDTMIEVIGQGGVELPHKNFENVLHVPNLSMNILSIYQIMHSSTRKRVQFTPDFVIISDMHDKSMIVVGEVNHQYHLYTFSKFIDKYDSSLLFTHVDDTSILWHKIFNDLKFKYMQQLCK
jgi:hypothetical protein